jgi:hypothetical protein
VTTPKATRRWVEVDKSGDDHYRNWLLRAHPDRTGPRLVIIQMNPSKAGLTDGERDPTTDRVELWVDEEHETSERFGEVVYLNVFARRATKPQDLSAYLFSDGYERTVASTDDAIAEHLDRADLVVAAWGDMSKLRKRWNDLVDRRVSEVLDILRGTSLHCVGSTLPSGQPTHSRQWNFDPDRALRPWSPPGSPAMRSS